MLGTLHTMEIVQLVKSAAEGDQRAWTALAGVLEQRLRGRFASRYGGLDGSDLIQDTLLVIWDKLPKFEMRSEAEFMSWVFKIARFMALTALRGMGHEGRVAGAVERAGRSPSTGISTLLDREQRLDSIRREIEKLPESLRRAAENMLAGGDARDLAEQMGVEWATVRGYESRAIKMLRERLPPPTPQS